MEQGDFAPFCPCTGQLAANQNRPAEYPRRTEHPTAYGEAVKGPSCSAASTPKTYTWPQEMACPSKVIQFKTFNIVYIRLSGQLPAVGQATSSRCCFLAMISASEQQIKENGCNCRDHNRQLATKRITDASWGEIGGKMA